METIEPEFKVKEDQQEKVTFNFTDCKVGSRKDLNWTFGEKDWFHAGMFIFMKSSTLCWKVFFGPEEKK